MISIILPVLWQEHYTQAILEDIPLKVKSDYEIILLDWLEWVNEKWCKWVEQAKWEYIWILNNDLVLTEWLDLKLIKLLFTNKVACPMSTRWRDKFCLPLITTTSEHNIAGWCFMMKKKDWIPIDSRLDIWYWDNWIYETQWRSVWFDWLCHHFESSTINSPEIKEQIKSRIDNDKLMWNVVCDEKWFENKITIS